MAKWIVHHKKNAYYRVGIHEARTKEDAIQMCRENTNLEFAWYWILISIFAIFYSVLIAIPLFIMATYVMMKFRKIKILLGSGYTATRLK